MPYENSWLLSAIYPSIIIYLNIHILSQISISLKTIIQNYRSLLLNREKRNRINLFFD